ncbi:MAG: two pore domain potassium channel family protein [Boseongicola sp. SB0665_bin_10]|nr:two pore domain potassium channel family protein [Boseongicola sp. SB0665_bin_10]
MKTLSPTSWLNAALAVAASLLLVVFPDYAPTPGHLFGIQLLLFLALLGACLKSVKNSPAIPPALIVLSVLAAILLHALHYMKVGLQVTRTGEVVTSPPFGEALYFSVMTFATLGYGDLAPREEHRLAAAFQALFGYLFLGLLAAALAVIIIRAASATARTPADGPDE